MEDFQFLQFMTQYLKFNNIMELIEPLQAENNLLVNEKTYKIFKTQISVIKKIMLESLKVSKRRFPQAIIYQISKFLFRNPITFRQTLFTCPCDQLINPNIQYLFSRTCRNSQLRQKQQRQQQHNITLNQQINRQKNLNQLSSYITLVKAWKPIFLSEDDYNQVLKKSKLFMVFLSKIKFYQGNQNEKSMSIDPLKDFYNYQKLQKEKSKYHYLIADNMQLTFSYFTQIFKYEKDKRINAMIIKSFVNLMSYNIAIVRIQQNYNTLSLGCQGKYIYIQNQKKLPLINSKSDIDSHQYPSLQVVENNQWKLVQNRENFSFKLYKEVNYPISRKINYLVTRKMQWIRQIDVWIQKIETKIQTISL